MAFSQLAHELRNPLTASIAHLALVQNPNLPQESRALSLQLLSSELHRLQNLLERVNLWEQSQLSEAYQHTVFDLAQVCETVLLELFPLAQQNAIEITLQGTEQAVFVRADPERISQVLLNLVGNALRYVGNGGLVRVRLQVSAPKVRVAVWDNGRGVPQKELAFLAEPFYRSSPSAKGSGSAEHPSLPPPSGLGLAIVTELLHHHQAQLRLESQMGEGSFFLAEFELALA
ncbi:MAG TPA: HAMP domain-containing sensor histidine kinase [Anaerolineales bacterium]|nr:HAMP domain-containing sensor histidine kinase [Anaerolineales bacterium]